MACNIDLVRGLPLCLIVIFSQYIFVCEDNLFRQCN